MTTPIYPRVGAQFFANRFMIHVYRAGVAMEHGAQAVLLLNVIAMTEDQARYKRGVRFWNSQLTAYIGCREDRLIQIRKRLTESGWLSYHRGNNRQQGLYWVLCPEGDDQLDDRILGANPDSPDDSNYGKAEFDTADKLRKSAVEPEEVIAAEDLKLRIRGVESVVEPVVEPVVLHPTPTPIPKYEEREPFEFVLKGGNTWTLTAEKLREYQTSFPGVDIEAELRTARQWCLDNATKRKTAGGMPRFLSRWLARNPKRLSAPVAARQSSTKGQAELTQGFGRDWAGITPELLRSPSQVMAWFDSQTSIPDTDENRVWCLASAKDASGPTIENPAALFVSLGKKLTQGQRSAPGDESYDWAKTQMRLWRAHSQAKYVHQGDAEPIQLRRASELTGAFV